MIDDTSIATTHLPLSVGQTVWVYSLLHPKTPRLWTGRITSVHSYLEDGYWYYGTSVDGVWDASGLRVFATKEAAERALALRLLERFT